MSDAQIAELLIRLSVGVVMVLFGAHQISTPSYWRRYMPGIIRFLLPIQSSTFFRIHGLGNVSIGLLLMSGLFPPVSACIALTWWIWVTPFAAYYDFSVGMRDFVIVMALLAVVFLQ